MGFKNLDVKIEYRSENQKEIIEDFYIPILSNAIKYKRASGFFSSSILIEIAKGLDSLIKNNGEMQLIVSPELSNEDIEAISTGYELREKVIERALNRRFYEHNNELEKERLNYLAHLISNNLLDIKVAVIDDGKTNGIYHEKIGIMYDENGNKIAFTGSLNETDNAIRRNFESIDVYRSWLGDIDALRVFNKERDFDKLWNNKTDRITIYKFPEAIKNKILKYKKDSIKSEGEIKIQENTCNNLLQKKYPKYPEWFHIRKYQEEAIKAWKENNFKGLLNMATGTGKTLTALSAVITLWMELKSKLAVIIVCPYTHLVEQWKEDVISFNMDPIVAYSTSKQKKWKNKMKNKIYRYNLGILDNVCILTTNATYKTKQFQEIINELQNNVLFIVDEVHNAGAEGFVKHLNNKFEFRLALSATPERYMDEEGTEHVLKYFGKEVYYFGLDRAIQEGFLTKYYYYPQIVYLTDDEYKEYFNLSLKLSKFILKEDGKIKLTERAKIYLIKRARLVAGAKMKLSKLRELFQNKKESNYNLIYCGSTYVENEEYDDEIRQIEAVTRILGNEMDMRIAKFTAEETMEERENIIRDFNDGKTLQGIVAIKCLDEGVNIPSIKNVYILASSTNPREFIQRRGRVLRKYKGKNFAYIYDFITLPRDLNKVSLVGNDVLKFDYSLIKKELIRSKEFASLALNKYESLKILEQIEEMYKKFMY